MFKRSGATATVRSGPCLGGLGPPRKLKKGPPPKRLKLHIFAFGLNSHLTFTYPEDALLFQNQDCGTARKFTVKFTLMISKI